MMDWNLLAVLVLYVVSILVVLRCGISWLDKR